MKYIKIILEGFSQAWGIAPKGNVKRVANTPTTNGLVGFIGCCMGLPREDPFLEEIKKFVRFKIVTNRPGIKNIDFVSDSYSGETVCKEYLEDASFTVYITSKNETLLNDIFCAIDDPKWIPYLGRKNCLPIVPIIPEWVEIKDFDHSSVIS